MMVENVLKDIKEETSNETHKITPATYYHDGFIHFNYNFHFL